MKKIVFILLAMMTLSIANAQFTSQVGIGKTTNTNIETYNSLQVNVGEPITYFVSIGSQVIPGMTVMATYQNDWAFDGLLGKYPRQWTQHIDYSKSWVIDFKKAIETYTVDVELNPMINSKVGPIIGFGAGQAVIKQLSIVTIVDNSIPGISMIEKTCPTSEEIKTLTYKVSVGLRLNIDKNYFISARLTHKWFDDSARYFLVVNNNHMSSFTIQAGVQL